VTTAHAKNEKWHGTATGYSRHKCRCDPCTDAWNAENLARTRAERRAAKQPGWAKPKEDPS